jgi:hypothetical protein
MSPGLLGLKFSEHLQLRYCSAGWCRICESGPLMYYWLMIPGGVPRPCAARKSGVLAHARPWIATLRAANGQCEVRRILRLADAQVRANFSRFPYQGLAVLGFASAQGQSFAGVDAYGVTGEHVEALVAVVNDSHPVRT